MRLKLSVFNVLIFALFLVILRGDVALSQGSDSTPTLDILIAIDISGSMDHSTNRNNRDQVDIGLRSLYSNSNITEISATDPRGDRFEVTRLALDWLAGYTSTSGNALNINATVLAFENDTQVILDWTSLNRPATQIAPSIDNLEPFLRDGDRNSDFRQLYTEIDQQLSASPNSGRGRQAVIVITDSLPCRPGRVTNNEMALYYDGYCEQTDRMVRHVDSLPEFSRNIGETILFINPIAVSTHWEGFPNLRSAWTNRVGNAAFRDLNHVSELSAAVMETLMQEIALVQGVVNIEDQRQRPELESRDYSNMGIAYSDSGSFFVAPYQSYMDVLVSTPNSQSVLNFSPESGTEPSRQTLLNSDSSSLRLVRINRPEAGQWTVTAGNSLIKIWTLFSPAESRITLVPPHPTLFTAQRLRYELLDNNGDPFVIDPEIIPQFNVNIQPPGADEIIDLSRFTIDNSDFKSLVSPAFTPITAGEHNLNMNITQGTTSTWRSDVDYSFLNPSRPLIVDVSNVSFNAIYEVVGVGVADIDHEVTANTVQMPRSLALNVKLEAEVDGKSIPLPLGIDAEINLNSIDNAEANACIGLDEVLPMTIRVDREYAERDIRFENSGACRIEISISFTSSLLPLNNHTQTLSNSRLSRDVTVTTTEYLNVVMLDQDGTVIPVGASARSADSPHYEMTDLNTSLPPWEPSALVLRLAIVDENNQPIEPSFLDRQNVSGRDHCIVDNASLLPAIVDEDTELEISDEPLPEIDAGRIVPFDLQILNDHETDISRSAGICFYATDSDGVYLATLTDISPGDYVVRVLFNRNRPTLDYNRFEYNPDLFSGQLKDTYEIEALLRVDANPFIKLQVYSAIGASLIAAFIIAGAAIRKYNTTKAPIKATPAIYRVPIDTENINMDELAQCLWVGEYPTTNKHTFPMTAFTDNTDLLLLGIQELLLDTRKDPQISKNSSAYFKLAMKGGGMAVDRLLEVGHVQKILEHNGYGYYMVNKPSSDVTIRNIIEKSGG